jgi:Tol biopolymer transport system component
LFVDDGVLTARPFDLDGLAFDGEPIAMAVGVTQTVDALWGGALFSVSETGSLLFVRGASERHAPLTLQWRDREGNPLGTIGEPQSYTHVRLSHDGRRLAVSRDDPGDIFLYDLPRDAWTRFTFDPGNDDYPVWSPGDDRIVFQSNRIIPGQPFSPSTLFEKAASGVTTEELIATAEGGGSFWPDDWSPDGSVVTATGAVPGTGASVMLFSTGNRTFTPYLAAGREEQSSRFSPDGRWLAYASRESGVLEVYVQAFPGPGGKWQISTAGGNLPAWRADGKELYYSSPEGLMAVPVDSTEGFRSGPPVRLFAFDRFVTAEGYYAYDVAPDGSRFIVLEAVADPASQDATVTLLQGWRALLDRSPR